MFSTLLNGLEALNEGGAYLPWRVCLMLNFLRDFGSMPPDDNFTEMQQKVFAKLKRCADDRRELPALRAEKWLELERWFLSMIDWAGVRSDFL